jgi:hypothetical protein
MRRAIECGVRNLTAIETNFETAACMQNSELPQGARRIFHGTAEMASKSHEKMRFGSVTIDRVFGEISDHPSQEMIGVARALI